MIDILTRAKKVTGYLKLRTTDVQNFNHFMPRYIMQLSGYYLVNAIKNYKRGILTECELIRL